MSALPRPDLPPGRQQELNHALHALHHQAGWPSLRTLAKQTGVSHTTVSKVFSTPALPTWGTRRTELAAVRRHLEYGTGLLLITGEAGTPCGPFTTRTAEHGSRRR